MTLGRGQPSEGGLPAAAPEPVDAAERTRVGVDEWVAEAEQRRAAQTGLSGMVVRVWEHENTAEAAARIRRELTSRLAGPQGV